MALRVKTTTRGRVPTDRNQLRDLVDRMLCIVDSAHYRVSGGRHVLDVAIGGGSIAFDPGAGSSDRPLEQLAVAVEACMMLDRSRSMLAAVDHTDDLLPLWLVTGSSVLAAWLSWSRNQAALRRRLAFSEKTADAPIMGYFERRARRDLGQGGIRIRVRNSLAVAEKIELAGRSRCIMTLGREARIRIEGNLLPETIISALQDDSLRNNRRKVAELVDHPFFISTDLQIAGIRNVVNAVEIDVKSDWGPLMPVPGAAWRAVPRGADLPCPWRATSREIAELYDLVDAGRGLAAS